MSTWLTQQQLYARVASIVACALVASACDLVKHTHSHTTEREVGSVLPDAARGYGGSRARIGIVSERPRNFGKVFARHVLEALSRADAMDRLRDV